MTSYWYIAKDPQGKKITGTYEDVEGANVLAQELNKLGYQLLKARKARRPRVQGKKVSEGEVVAFAFQFSGMYGAGMSVIQCLRTLKEQSENAAFKNILADICQKVEKGVSLHQAFTDYQAVFSPFFLGMIEAGETGGRLSKSLEMAAVYLEKRNELRQKVKSAFVYPMVVSTVCFLVIGAMLIFVVPMFDKLYQRLHVPLPGPTQLLIDISHGLHHYWFFVISGLLVLIYLGQRFCQDPRLRYQWDTFKLKMPVFGPLNRLVIVSRFTRTFATLASVGVSLIDALDVAAVVAHNRKVEEIIKDIQESIRAGNSVAKSFHTHPIFPLMVIQMAESGEQAGVLEEMLFKGADFLDKMIQRSVNRLLIRLEPILTLTMGLLIGAILLAVYFPMFDYMNHLK